MITKTISTTYSLGYLIQTGISTLLVKSTGYVGGTGVTGGDLNAYSVINHGGIVSAAGYGVDLLDGGSVSNGGASDSAALISGALGGITIAAAAGTVINSGKIIGTYTTADGIQLLAGGSVSNRASGLIQGGYIGIRIDGAAGTVVNSGTIVGNGATGEAIGLYDGGSITNTASGTITAVSDGVYINGAAGTVFNSGTIVGGGGYNSGVSLIDGGSVANTASGRITSGGFGVIIEGAPGTIVNSGTIEGQLDAVILFDGGSVTNTTSGLIVGGNAGVQLSGTLVNAGTIEGTRAGALVDPGAVLTNTRSGVIESGHQGIVAHGTVINAGTIEGALGVGLFDGGVLINDASGVINATTYAGVYSLGNNTIINYGVITGASGALRLVSSDLLEAEARSKIVGVINGGGGTLELGAGAGAGTIAGIGSSASASSTNRFSGFGQYQIASGASWTFTRDSRVASALYAPEGTPQITPQSLSIESGGRLINLGTIDVAGGVFVDDGTLVNKGAIDLTAGVFVDNGAVSGSAVINFRDDAGTVEGSAAHLAALRFESFGLGDTIDLTGLGFVKGETAAYTAGHLELESASHDPLASLALTGRFTGVSLDVVVVGDGKGGTELFENGNGVYAGDYGSLGLNRFHTTATVAATGRIRSVSGIGISGGTRHAYTIDNFGMISVGSGNTASSAQDAGVAAGSVISFRDGGAVIDEAGATIEGGPIVIEGGAGTVVNAGGILNVGGILFGDGGYVSDAADATIEGGPIVIEGGYGTVVDAGGILNVSGVLFGDGGYVSVAGSSLINGSGVAIHGADGTVDNAGMIEGTRDGVVLYGGGNVTNTVSGTITGVLTGIFADGPTATVVNSGVISGSLLGVAFSGPNSGFSLTNTASGVISGPIAVILPGFGATVTNFGTIVGTYSPLTSTLSGFGVYDPSSGGTIINYGEISGGVGQIAVKAGVGSLVEIEGGSSTIGEVVGSNYNNELELGAAGGPGTLSGLGGDHYIYFPEYVVASGANWTIAGYNAIAAGDTLTNGGTLTIDGTLSLAGSASGELTLGGGGVLTNSGLISNAGLAVIGAGRDASVGNSGTITSTIGAIIFDARGAVANKSGAALISGTDFGVYLGGGGRVTNDGTISASEDYGVHLGAGGSVDNRLTSALIEGGLAGVVINGGTGVVANFGTIEAKGKTGIGVMLLSDGTIVNYGAIISEGGAAVLLGGGADVLEMAAGATVVGAIEGGAGNDTFEFTASGLTSGVTLAGGGGVDTLAFTTEGTLAASAFSHVSGIEVLRLANGADELTIGNALVAAATGKTLTIDGGIGADVVNAASVAASDTLIFDDDRGADTIIGGKGDNIYEFKDTSGALTINNGFAGGTSAHGDLKFGAGITDEKLWFVKQGANLVAEVVGATDHVTLDGWFGANASARVSEITAGGLTLDSSVARLVAAMASFQASDPGFNPTASGSTIPTNETLQQAIAAAWHK